MKAAVIQEIGTPLAIEDIPDPEPGLTDLILKVGACGICGTDLHMSENKDPNVGWRMMHPGCVMGHEFAGEVMEVGRDARQHWHPGDRVTALPWIGCGECPACRAGLGYRCPNVISRATADLPGAYAEYCRVGAYETIRLPDQVSYREGALVEPLAVGFNAVRRANLKPGDRVLIVGAGPVGLTVAMWCRFFGAQHIVVSDLVPARAQRSLALGATAIVDASAGDVPEQAAAAAGGPPRVVFDCVGVPGSLQLVIDYAAPNAQIVVVGLCMAGDHLFPTKALVKELDISFAYVYRQDDFASVVHLLGEGRIDTGPLVSDKVDLTEFPTAFEDLKQPNLQIKVMLEVD